MKWVYVNNITEAKSDEPSDRWGTDYWTSDHAERELSAHWTARVMMEILRPKPPAGYQWADGRLTRLQVSSQRPRQVWPDSCQGLSAKGQKGSCIILGCGWSYAAN